MLNNQYIRNIIGNKLIQFIKENPDKELNYRWLSKNPNITWDIVKNYPDKEWNY